MEVYITLISKDTAHEEKRLKRLAKAALQYQNTTSFDTGTGDCMVSQLLIETYTVTQFTLIIFHSSNRAVS